MPDGKRAICFGYCTAATDCRCRVPDQVGARYLELRVNDKKVTWRVMLRVDDDAIVILEVFDKKTGRTPK